MTDSLIEATNTWGSLGQPDSMAYSLTLLGYSDLEGTYDDPARVPRLVSFLT